jgi:hypothetical protein
MKQVGKVYSAVDADELEAGDIVQLSDYPRAEKMTKCEGCKFYKWYDLNLYNEPTWVKVCMNPKRENVKESSERCKLKEK